METSWSMGTLRGCTGDVAVPCVSLGHISVAYCTTNVLRISATPINTSQFPFLIVTAFRLNLGYDCIVPFRLAFVKLHNGRTSVLAIKTSTGIGLFCISATHFSFFLDEKKMQHREFNNSRNVIISPMVRRSLCQPQNISCKDSSRRKNNVRLLCVVRHVGAQTRKEARAIATSGVSLCVLGSRVKVPFLVFFVPFPVGKHFVKQGTKIQRATNITPCDEAGRRTIVRTTCVLGLPPRKSPSTRRGRIDFHHIHKQTPKNFFLFRFLSISLS